VPIERTKRTPLNVSVATLVSVKPVLAVCVLVLATSVHAEPRPDRSVQARPAPPRTLLNPVAFIGEVIATLRGTIERSEVDAEMLARRSAAIAGLSVPFASGRESDRVSLVLAESELRIKLAQDVQLRCEVSSRDEANIDPELQLGIGVQFTFK
jgi:hypothetical protein